MSPVSTISPASEVVIFDAGGVMIKAKLLIDGSVSLVRSTASDGGPARFFDVPPSALAGLAIVIADGLTLKARERSKPVSPAGIEPDIHEALLAASGQSDLAGEGE